MLKKNYLTILSVLLIPMSVFAQTFSQSGTVTDSSLSSDRLVISNQEYLIDHNTVVHGLAPQGEKGPIVNEDTAIGFNTSRGADGEPPYITEIWLLNE
ncbi:MAG TPA: hypothetical protein EYM37_02265 [Methylophaga aminisulfidivorans]|uniref:Uncharacterized protein n=2 Tax=Methylophaga TaxID=40222 RepID=F5SZU3_9GAMM|nr:MULTISPECIES: hypothetical protein [Methylophaga]EGL54693.1 hypothetical protein MAMP_01571 [Methylophaga aminisulfidivorans MP]GLQ01042.1 hypothetical protein GCM10007891_28950 [Methylophaga thalassica]HIC47348.1 hypothetical protein [Methylophaga sp.]HIM38740.1 hypothetical protein [Methylophaga aminisulfidivorans]